MPASSDSLSILDDSAARENPQAERFEKVRTLVRSDSAAASAELAREVAALIREKAARGERTVLGLATGSTPVPFYRELVRMHREEELSFATVTTFNLDEYYGLAKDHPESYHRFMRDQLFDHVDIAPDQAHVPDGTVPLEEVYDACQRYEAMIEEAGGLDLQILGIGRTGHIGFNEPGSTEDSVTRMITLDRVTRQDAAADFMGVANVPRSAITMGVGTILKARHIVLMAWGANKAGIVRDAVEGPVSDLVPATFLQRHGRAVYLVDEAASARLTRYRHPWLVGSVAWDPPMRKRAVVWLSRKLEKPILKLVDEDYNESGAGELLAGSSEVAYEVNIDCFNHVQHTITGWPGGKPGSDDSRRPERAEPFPKRVLVLSPEPGDVFTGMGGTLERLKEQGHEVRLLFQTSGNLRVSDVAALNFARVVLEMAESGQGEGWEQQRDYARRIIAALEEKGTYGVDPELVRRLKGLILRGEARDAAALCGLAEEAVAFLDLPFYEQGRYRRFRLGDEDVASVAAVLAEFRPQQVFATGAQGDPSSVEALAFRSFAEAVERVRGESWFADCRVWLYAGRDVGFESHEIDMAVPMSPDQLEQKIEAVSKFMSNREEGQQAGSRNRETAREYDALGLAEYEAIEAFRRWEC